uniref:GLOBIN domain-containing protein n=1 Tax=Rhabditophanes sp. KR3021 TaxID=114890 RepID=A0AC35U4Q1_9BILA
MMPICGISEHTKYFILLFDRIIDNEPNIEDTLRKIGRVHVKLYEEYKLTIADIERLGEIVADVFLKLDGIRQNKETSKSWRILIASIFDEVRVGYESELRLCRRKSSNFPDFSNPSSSRNSNPSILEGLPSTSGSNMGPSSSKIGDICQKISEL